MIVIAFVVRALPFSTDCLWPSLSLLGVLYLLALSVAVIVFVVRALPFSTDCVWSSLSLLCVRYFLALTVCGRHCLCCACQSFVVFTLSTNVVYVLPFSTDCVWSSLSLLCVSVFCRLYFVYECIVCDLSALTVCGRHCLCCACQSFVVFLSAGR